MRRLRGIKLIYYRLLIVACLAAATGCTPTSFWYKAGASTSKLNSDFVNCRVRAAQSVPVNTQVRTTPTYVTPGQTNCYSTGYTTQCNTYGGQVHGGQTYSYDSNEKLRNEVVAQCMAQMGYQSISLPNCSKEQAKNMKPYTNLPTVKESSCVVQTKSGSRIVNP